MPSLRGLRVLLACSSCLLGFAWLCLLAFLFALPAWLDLLAYFAFLLSPPERHMHASFWYAPSRAAPGSNTCLLRVRAPAGLRQIKKRGRRNGRSPHESTGKAPPSPKVRDILANGSPNFFRTIFRRITPVTKIIPPTCPRPKRKTLFDVFPALSGINFIATRYKEHNPILA